MAPLLSLLVLFALTTDARAEPPPPEPRPLGADIPIFRAPEEPIHAPSAEPAPAGEGMITLRDALALALMRNPRLAAFSWETRAREAEVLQAGRRPNPELAFEAENFAGSGEVRSFDAADFTLALSQVIELGGKRGRRRELAESEQTLAFWDYETTRLDVLTDVTREFVGVIEAQQRVQLTQDLIDVAEQTLASVSRRVRAGAVTQIEESRARVELATSRIENLQAKHALNATRARLAATWGENTARFKAAVGELETTPHIPDLALLLDRSEQNPDLARWVAELEARTAAVALEQSRGTPDLTLELGLRHLRGTGDHALVAGVGLPLPIFDRNRDAMRAAEFRTSLAGQERRASGAEVGAHLVMVYEALSAAAVEITALRDEVLPVATSSSDAARQAYNRGLFTLTDVLDTQRTLFELRSRYFSALARYHDAVALIERLTGNAYDDLLSTGEGD